MDTAKKGPDYETEPPANETWVVVSKPAYDASYEGLYVATSAEEALRLVNKATTSPPSGDLEIHVFKVQPGLSIYEHLVQMGWA